MQQPQVAHVLCQSDLSSGFNAHQQKTLHALQQCRTAALGGHVDVCTDCAAIHISYNSCRKCQGHKKQEWIRRREAELLPCTYFHVVFTLPPQLNSLAFYNTPQSVPRKIYSSPA